MTYTDWMNKAGRLLALALPAVALVISLASPAQAEDGVVLKGVVEQSSYIKQEIPVYQKPGIIGVDFIIRPGEMPLVKDVFRHSPAHVAGIRPGDTVIAINGHSALGKSRRQVDLEISDIPGDRVILTVQREGAMRHVDIRVAAIEEVHPSLQAMYASVGP